MNFLELVNNLRRETSAAGLGVSTVLNQTGEAARLIQWIQQANEHILNQFFDWKFLRREGTFTTQIGVNIIQAPLDLNIWDIENIYDAENNQMNVIEKANLIGKIDEAIDGVPCRFIIKDDNTLLCDPKPITALIYNYDYFIKPAALTTDTDVPLFPEQYHRAIVGLALVYYSNYESAAEMKAQGGEMFSVYYDALRKNQLPNQSQTYGRSNSIDIQVIAE